MRIAFATYKGKPQGSRDDALAAVALPREAEVLTIPWDRPEFDWASVDAVVLRSCWDYHLRLAEFLSWIARLEALGVAVVNSGKLVRWNANKTYLRGLASSGVRVVPTIWVAPNETIDLKRILAEAAWPRAVVKPAVGASSYQTHVVQAKNANEISAHVFRNGEHGGFLVQPFLEEIVDDGEWSLMFFGGRLSHAVIKRARPGEFRVQSEFQGTAERQEADENLVEQARSVLDHLPERPFYARVDGVVRDGAFVLMELELIEPQLFFSLADGAASRFASCVMDLVNSR